MRSSVFKFLARCGVVAVFVLAAYTARPFAAQNRQFAAHPAQASPQTPASPSPAAQPPISLADARTNAWKVLNDGLADKELDHRAGAISALGTIGVQPEVVPLVEGGLDDKSVTVREVAATTLGRMKSRGSIPKLRAALDDESPAVVYAAATSLWQMNDNSGEEILAEILEGDRKASRKRVDQGLHAAHEKLHDPKELLALGAEMSAEGFFPPAVFGVKLVEYLSKDKAASPRAASALLLGDGTDAYAHDALGQALADNSWIVRAAAAEALSRHGTQDDIALLAPLLKDEHYEVRYEAAAAIVRLAPRT
ncbi:MAG TPA: HEAT repeat domain-containing protein [Candidatus Acidoferrum sp.]|nr:HEAT repeat domain-containing protein [Candidatus Acidoferrum sp.]